MEAVKRDLGNLAIFREKWYEKAQYSYKPSAGDMEDKKDKPEKDPFLDSAELFENLFREAPLEEDKKPKPAPAPRKEVKPSQGVPLRRPERTRQAAQPRKEPPPAGQASKAATGTAPPRGGAHPEKPVQGRKVDLPPKTPAPRERIADSGPLGARTGERQKPGLSVTSRQPLSKKKKASRGLLKAMLFLLLLGIGAAAGAAYLGYIDPGKYLGGLQKEEPRPAPPQVARPTPEKKPPPQIPVKSAAEKPKPQTALPKPEPPEKEVKPPAPVSRPAPPPPDDRIVGAKTPEPLPAPPKVERQMEQPPHYPFSVYLGAFMTLDRARIAVSIYERDHGISSHWVKVDLGEKGVWYRIFTGHFKTAQEAEAFIRQKQLEEGEVKQTRYSTLIGEYAGQEDAVETVRKLLNLGYASYFVPGPGGRINLFSGAFYTLQGAQKQHAEFASKGIKSRVVER